MPFNDPLSGAVRVSPGYSTFGLWDGVENKKSSDYTMFFPQDRRSISPVGTNKQKIPTHSQKNNDTFCTVNKKMSVTVSLPPPSSQ